MSRIAVIGTGNMGAPMAINLVEAGFQVSAFDIVSDKTAALVQHGVDQAATHLEAITGAKTVLTMLPTGKEVQEVWSEHILGQAAGDCVLIDSSTIDLATAKDIHASAAGMGYQAIDAPVSGGTPGAAAGKLTFMVGGSESALTLARSVLDAMGSRVIHCGDGGMGQAAKMCNNMMLGIQMASVAEGFQLARKVGLADQTLYDVASSSSADCFSLRTFCPVPDVVESCPANNDYQPGFSADLMLKDMGLALAAAESAQLGFDLAPVAEAIYRSFSEAGHGSKDFSGVFTQRETEPA